MLLILELGLVLLFLLTELELDLAALELELLFLLTELGLDFFLLLLL